MRTALSSLAVVLVISGCGYKGPLYLPKPKPALQKPAPAPPAQSGGSKADDAPGKSDR